MEVISGNGISHRSETLCKFWAVGKCTKGSDCLYTHSWHAATMAGKGSLRATPVTWLPPPPDWIKINTDGAVRGSTGASSCGAVFRDSAGDVQGAFSSFLGTNLTPLEAEMQGVIRAIDIASSHGLRKVWLETDSGQTVSLLKDKETEVPDFMRSDWCNMLKQIERMEDVVVSHIYREGNTVADKLANYGIESGDAFIAWDHQAPDFILREAHLDASRHTYYRVRG